jgi:hypothetical protein
MRFPPREFLQGTLGLLILRTLLAEPARGHGIAKQSQHSSEALLGGRFFSAADQTSIGSHGDHQRTFRQSRFRGRSPPARFGRSWPTQITRHLATCRQWRTRSGNRSHAWPDKTLVMMHSKRVASLTGGNCKGISVKRKAGTPTRL